MALVESPSWLLLAFCLKIFWEVAGTDEWYFSHEKLDGKINNYKKLLRRIQARLLPTIGTGLRTNFSENNIPIRPLILGPHLYCFHLPLKYTGHALVLSL